MYRSYVFNQKVLSFKFQKKNIITKEGAGEAFIFSVTAVEVLAFYTLTTIKDYFKASGKI